MIDTGTAKANVQQDSSADGSRAADSRLLICCGEKEIYAMKANPASQTESGKCKTHLYQVLQLVAQ